MPRTRKLTHGTHLRDLVHPLPTSGSSRRARHTPDGRRRDDGVLTRRAPWPKRGEVTVVLAKQRRNDRPKKVQIIVTNLMEAHAGAMLSMDAWRWGVEVTIKERKSGWHLGQRPVTNDKERVTRAVSLSVLASLLLVCLYGREEASTKAWSRFKRTERFIGEVAHEAVRRISSIIRGAARM
jgi:hypothetical protein